MITIPSPMVTITADIDKGAHDTDHAFVEAVADTKVILTYSMVFLVSRLHKA